MSEPNVITKGLSLKEIIIIKRALGVIEGLTYAVQDTVVADGIVGAIERIESGVRKYCSNSCAHAFYYENNKERLKEAYQRRKAEREAKCNVQNAEAT